MAQPFAGRSPDVEEAIVARVEQRAGDWFPDAGRRPAARLRRLVERPRAVLYAVHLDGGPRPHVLAKVRRGWPGGDGGERPGARPRLSPGSLPPSEQTALEYAGLRAIQAMVVARDPRFGAVRPLDHLVGHDTILMEYVDAPTFRRLLLSGTRLSAQRATTPPPGTGTACRQAGAWLDSFQRELSVEGLPERQATRHDVVDRFLAYDEYLRSRLGRRAAGEVARRGAEIAAHRLPERLPLAVGHGDYAPRNMFVGVDGRLSVFDPMPRWAVPRHEDLCRLLVAMRLSGIQVHTRGAAFSHSELDRRERDVIAGYLADGQLALPELRCYQLLITLDKWSALVDRPAVGWRGRLRTASLRWTSGYLRREAERLLAICESDGDRNAT